MRAFYGMGGLISLPLYLSFLGGWQEEEAEQLPHPQPQELFPSRRSRLIFMRIATTAAKRSKLITIVASISFFSFSYPLTPAALTLPSIAASFFAGRSIIYMPYSSSAAARAVQSEKPFPVKAMPS